MPKLPKLPEPDKVINVASKGIDIASRIIASASNGIDKITNAMGRLESVETPPPSLPESVIPSPTGVSNEATLKYQLDLILDDLEHLETEHLPGQGRLNGESCDCIAKASRSLRRHANETIPIASRQGKASGIFSELRDWAQHLMDIGTINQVTTGKYDGEYLEQAGTASNYRKQIEKMFAGGGNGGSGKCSSCEEVKESLKNYIEKRKREGRQVE